jgi:hypothetical protein
MTSTRILFPKLSIRIIFFALAQPFVDSAGITASSNVFKKKYRDVWFAL